MRAGPFLLVTAVFGLLAATLPPVGADAAEAKLVLLHDVRDDGYTYVGNPNQFAYLMLTPEGTPTVHKQGKILITQNDVKLYETLGGATGYDTAHDYDAFNGFVFAFPTQGPYTIHTEIPVGGTTLTADFSGYVHAPPLVKVNLAATVPASAMAGALVPITVELQGEDGKILPHTDALVEVRRAADNFLVFRTHVHTHNDPMKLEYAFREAGEHVVRITGFNAYPEPDIPAFAPVSKDFKVSVTGGTTGAPAVPAPAPTNPGEGRYVLFASYDPDDIVNPFGNIRLNALVLQKESLTQASHVDYAATLYSPTGTVLFRSQALHEYDGNLEVVTQNAQPGDYRMRVDASVDGWKGSIDLNFRVIPAAPSVAATAGPTIITAKGLDLLLAGKPSRIEFSARNLAGTPHQHSEIDLQVHEGAAPRVPFLMNKLHTHADGNFAIDVVFPTEGDHVLILDAETVHADATPAYYYKQVGGRLVVPVKVAPGIALPDVPPIPAQEEPVEPAGTLPAPGLAGFLVALAALGLAVRARRD